jgi:hypothetical protein
MFEPLPNPSHPRHAREEAILADHKTLLETPLANSATGAFVCITVRVPEDANQSHKKPPQEER